MTVTVSPLARLDALDAEVRLDREQPGYGAAFTDEFAAAVDAIRTRPRSLSPTEDGPDGVETREYYIRRFEYRVIFVLRDGGAADVLAVIHARRRPGSWESRLSDPTEI